MALSAPPPPSDREARRLARLAALRVLDSDPEPLFEALAATAASVCGTPIALLSLIDTERQWFKANVGLPGVSETSREVAFCDHAIRADQVMVVEDASSDPRFADNPLVTGDPHIRFYCGAPVTLSDGQCMGTLCVIDRETRTLTLEQKRTLAHLATAAAASLEMRERECNQLHRSGLAEQRFVELYQSTPGMLHSVDPEGRFVAVSDRWLTSLGYTREEVIGRHATEFMTPASAHHAREVSWPDFFRTGRSESVAYQYVKRNGEVIDVELSALLERDGQGIPLRTLAVMQDVTARKRAEAELLRSRDRLQSIIDGTNVGTWEWNVQTDETCFNERWAEMLGYSLADLEPVTIGTWASHVHPEDLARSSALIKAHFAGESDFYSCECRVRHRDGHWIWVLDCGRVAVRDEHGKPLWMMGTHLDLTEQKLAAQQSLERKVLLERTGRIANVGGWDFDLKTRALTWSDQMCAIYDVEPSADMDLERALSFYRPKERVRLQQAIADALRDARPWDLEMAVRTATGRHIWVHSAGNAVFEQGRPVRLVGAVQDISARRRAEHALQESRELLQVTLNSIADAVITTDGTGMLTWLNPAAERLTGWSQDAAMGRPIDEVFRIIDDTTSLPTDNPVMLCLAQSASIGLTENITLVARDGTQRAIQDSASVIRDREGHSLGVVLVFRDVSEQRRLNREMKYRATHDSLTGLFNRPEFEVRLKQTLENAQVENSQNALMCIDLDQFKIVNDTCGHAVGDEMLQQVAKIFDNCVRKRDVIARLGGDEFGVILSHCDMTQAKRVAQSICDAMNEFRFQHDGKRYRVGASIGLAPVNADSLSEAAVLQAADSACYAAKEAGRNRVHLWREKDHAIRSRQGQVQWARRIEQALDDDRLVLHGQRIVPVDGPYVGLHCEVLLRMLDDNGGLVAPNAFLPAAERYHLATRIDRWVIDHVFAWMTRAGEGVEPVAMISINLSGQSIGDRAFHRFLAEKIASATFDIGKLCLEITETAVITHIGDARHFVDEMRRLGIRIALDDFGAGASSFGYLKSLPVHYLKIDGQFIRDLISDPLDRAAVNCFAEVARVVGIETVAEFVENEETMRELRHIGINYVQGYLTHKPEALEHLLCPPHTARRASVAN